MYTRHAIGLLTIVFAGLAGAQPFYPSTSLTPSEPLMQCGQWVESRRSPGATNELIQRVYIWGMLSGMTAASPYFHSVEIPLGTSISAWLDKYCANTPLGRIETGAYALMIELATAQGIKLPKPLVAPR